MVSIAVSLTFKNILTMKSRLGVTHLQIYVRSVSPCIAQMYKPVAIILPLTSRVRPSNGGRNEANSW